MTDVGVSARGPVIAHHRGRSTAWWGTMGLMVSETILFSLLLAVYLYHRGGEGAWPPAGLPMPELAQSGVRSVLLIGSSLPMVLAERAMTHHRRPIATAVWLVATLVLSGIFLAGHVHEQFKLAEELHPTEQVYGAVVMTILNFHGAHLVAGMLMLAFVLVGVLSARVTTERATMLKVSGMYWHFVDGIWVVVYGLLYVSPHLLGRA